MTKPFSPEELLARIRVALRRVFDTAGAEIGCVRHGELDHRLRPASRVAWIDGDSIDAEGVRVAGVLLAPSEPGPDASRILTTVWGPHAAARSEHLWVLAGQLRKKLEPDPSHPRYLLSEPWIGYRFVVDADEAPVP